MQLTKRKKVYKQGVAIGVIFCLFFSSIAPLFAQSFQWNQRDSKNQSKTNSDTLRTPSQLTGFEGDPFELETVISFFANTIAQKGSFKFADFFNTYLKNLGELREEQNEMRPAIDTLIYQVKNNLLLSKELQIGKKRYVIGAIKKGTWSNFVVIFDQKNNQFKMVNERAKVRRLIQFIQKSKTGIVFEDILGRGAVVWNKEKSKVERSLIKTFLLPDWLKNLFSTSHLEFLDTFDPVKFFLDHKERSLSQISGISLIWAAMIATAIGAPFGLDWLISGSPYSNIPINLFGSALGFTSLLAGVRHLNLKHSPSRTEQLFLSIKYYLYPTNVVIHSFCNLIFRIFKLDSLTKTRVGEAQYEWATREQGMENVGDAIRKNRPDLLERYENLNRLPPREREQEEESLRNELYRITRGHFNIWGLRSSMNQESASYFHGSHIIALMTLFPDLNLNPLGFQLDWSTKEKGIESVRYVLSKEIPHIMQQYERIAELSDRDIHDLKNKMFEITHGCFRVWGLDRVIHRQVAPYFNGSYMNALITVFPKLNLNPLGFQLDWSTKEKGIESVRYVLSKEAPHIMQQYERIDQLNDREIHDLRNEIQRITSDHFKVWGLSGAMTQESAPYFHGSHIDVLIAVFPRLDLNPLGFQLDWSSEGRGIESVRYVFFTEAPHIMQQYEKITQLNDREIHDLRNEIYGIKHAHFKLWGLSAAMSHEKAPYFHGSHMNVLISVFNHSGLGLTLQGFKDYRRATFKLKYSWGTRESGIWSVREGIRSNRPDIIERYENLGEFNANEIERLKRDIYGITQAHFGVWGLGAAMTQESAPYFHGSYIHALMSVFPDLNLNPLGFQLDWSTKEKGIESVKYVLSREIPHILQQYEKLDQLSERYLHDLRNKIYKITSGHFNVWELGAAMNQRSTPYFQGSHINALLAVFPHTKLGLTREGFAERSGNGTSYANQEIEQMDNSDPASPLMTEDTRKEVVKREMNPNGWITQLFFAPHYEFLDTFNPVQFFKSHREQTLGQAIGIVLIWGAMVATMIGAPFGIDYIISGSPTNHLGITLLTSFIGSLSILAGIRLNHLASYTPNRTEKFILSIAYLSYPVNVLTHHLFNLISNLTRPLGKWRLAPLTKTGVGEYPYQWNTREQGIENVRDGIKKNRPDLLERYENLDQLPLKEREQEEKSLRNEVYGITQAHFNVWGLSRAMDQESAPYFHGSHINSLMTVFPNLNLNALGFQLDWSNEERGIQSVRYVLSKEAPHIMQQYERIAELSDGEIQDLRNAIYGIKQGHFKVWGLAAAINQQRISYFHGSYITALIAVFPDLNLNPLGFQLDWSTKEKGIESVRYVLSKEAPHIMQQYERIDQLNDREIHDLRNEIYGIKQAHFSVWGLVRTEDIQAAPYFHGSYKDVLISVFNHSGLGLSLQGFKDYRRATFEKKYSWGTRESGIWSVREGIRSNRPDIIERYENLAQLNANEIERLKRDIYGITQAHFNVWGFSGAMNQKVAPYFHGSYMNALISVFPDLNLNPLGFKLDWSSEERAVESVKYVLSKEVPHIMRQYKRIAQLDDKDIHNLRNAIYRITTGYFQVWGLSGAMSREKVPYFHGSHINSLMTVFPNLNLNALGFQLDWSNEERGIQSVRYVLSKEAPHIMQQYERISELNDREIHALRNEVYGITYAHFQLWELGAAMNQESAPYFQRSHINALLAVFPDLNLNPLGFQLDWSSKENGIESVRYVLSKEAPHIMKQYERILELNDREIHALRNEIYRITSVYFSSWGLSGAMNQRLAPYFHGRYVDALLAVFSHSNLGLTREGFAERTGNGTSYANQETEQMDNSDPASPLMTEDTRKEVVKRGMNPNGWIAQLFFAPHYEFLDTFNPIQFFKSHREQTLGQAIGIVLIWGAMVATMIGAPFGIDYIISGSPTNHLGITLVSAFIGSLSIVAGIRLNQLASYNLNRTEKFILSIAYLSYPVNVLTHHLFNLISNLTRPLGKWRLVPLTKTGVGEDQYEWTTREQGMENVRDAIRKNRPDLLERYENLNQLPPNEREQKVESLRKEIYRITSGHFKAWGLGTAMNQESARYFHGSHVNALMAVFSDLDLNLLGFQLDWSSKERGIESVRYVLSKEAPQIMQQYERIAELSDREIHELRNEIYGIKQAHFNVWGLSGAMTQQVAPYFHGSHINVMMAVFHNLNLNPLGFQLDWSSEEKGVESVKYVLSIEIPHIMQQYERIMELSDREIHDLRNEVYGITQAHFNVWGLSRAMNQESAPYFHGSHINSLMTVFPNLNLNALGFQLDWSNEERGIQSVRYALSKEAPHIMQQYKRIAELSDGEIQDLRNAIYGIKQGHFKAWGLAAAINQQRISYFHGSYITALIAVFPDLNLNPLGFQLDWSTKEKGIESVRYVLSKEAPHIMQQYERIDQLNDREIHDLRNEIYGIKQAHFSVWGLVRTQDFQAAPYFHGSYKDVLISVFNHSGLGLSLQGFKDYRRATFERKYSWATRESGIWSVREGIRSNRPDIIDRYENLAQLNANEIERLKRDIYGITQGHFRVWGLGGAMNQKSVPYFHGSYIVALMALFSDLNLNALGFRLDWSTKDKGIESVKYVLSKETPHIMQQYERITQLNDREIHELRNKIYGITQAHFSVWGLGATMTQESAPYFHGSYMNALMSVFPDLNLNPLGFQLDWSTKEKGIESVRYVLSKEAPHIMQQYERIAELSDGEIHGLRNDVYGIIQGHFNVWGLSRTKDHQLAPYFHGSYMNALMAVFPDLNLNPLGFQLDWSSKENGIESVKYVLSKEIPHIMKQYERISQLNERDVHNLRNEIYGITYAHFQLWELGAAMNQRSTPYFQGSHINALLAVFPDLNLNPFGFKLDWSSEEKGIESVRYVLSEEVPHIMKQYERILELNDREIHALRNEIYRITSVYFSSWGLSGAMNQKSAPYFHGRYVDALLAVFSHSNLGLTREGFAERTGNGISYANQEIEQMDNSDPASPLMTEDTSNEAEDNSTLDILEPLVQPQKRFKTWQARIAYYLFVGSWEESFFRWGGLILLPLNLHALGLDLAISSSIGFSISAFGFLFSHTIVRWMVSRNSDKWKGWKIEVKNDFLSSKLISTLLLNTIFITALIFHPISPSLVLLLTISTHSLFDFSKAHAKDKVDEKSVNQEIREVADALNEPEEELNHLFSESRVHLNSILNSVFGLWTKESKSPQLYIIDLNSLKDLESRIALFRTIQQIKDYKKSHPREKIKCVIVKKNGQSIEEIEKILGLKDILFIADSPEETVEKLKVLAKKQSFSIRLVTVPQNSKTWLNLLAQNFKFIDIKMMVLQLLDVGRAIRINLSQLGASNSETNEWMEKLIEDGEAEIEGEEAVIKAVPFEPPSKEEESKIQQLFNEQA